MLVGTNLLVNNLNHPKGQFMANQDEATLENQKAILDNQDSLLKNQSTIISNQESILKNQEEIKSNQEVIKSNQEVIVTNQSGIIGNQKQIVDNQTLLDVISKTQAHIFNAVRKLSGKEESLQETQTFLEGLKADVQGGAKTELTEPESL